MIQIQRLRMPEALRWILQYGPSDPLRVANINKGIDLWQAYLDRYDGSQYLVQTVDFELQSFDLTTDKMALFKLMFAA